MIKNSKLFLILIVLLAGFLRFYNIGINPPSLSWDEVALGYNAYSLGINGRDEFGVLFPYKYLESYGDFKPPVYSYLGVLPIKIFGLNEFAVRFPSALLGTLSVLLTYLLVKQIFYTKKKILKFDLEPLALLSALILALSPWHIMLSRAAFEANVATFFIIAGTLFYLLGINKKGYYFVLSAIFYVLTFYTFNSSRVFVPLFVILISLLSFKDLLKNKKWVLFSAFIGILMLAPIASYLHSPQATLRFKEVNIFSDSSIVVNANKKIAENNNSIWAKAVYNRRVGYTQAFISHYVDHFEPRYLFINGDNNPRFSIRQVGQMYLWDALFLLIGIIVLIKIRPGKWYILPLWILLGIIPAATARETPHALRTEAVLPAFQILVAFGFMTIYVFIKTKTKFANLIAGFLLILLLINFAYFYKILMIDYPKKYAGEWQYHYKEVAQYVNAEKGKYEKVYVDEEIGRPYIYNLFYNNISPADFQNKSTVQRDVFGLVNVTRFENIYYERALRSTYDREPENLYVQSINDPKKISYSIPQDAKVLKTLRLPNGQILFIIYTKNN